MRLFAPFLKPLSHAGAMARLTSLFPRASQLAPSAASKARLFSTSAPALAAKSQEFLRNIGISAHIDSGKTTLTERVLFYTGRIREMHEVRGKDGVGATMDSMDLEREKGITIQSAATYTTWGDYHINVIDTPGHVDFTVEVERALRVLDGAVLVLCAVGGVQSQTNTVDRQMRRYNVPRIAFINKCDRPGSDPAKVIRQLREKLRHNAAAVQLPIGLESDMTGVIDLVNQEAVYFEGDYGEKIRRVPIPEGLAQKANDERHKLIESVSEVDDDLAELYVMEEPITADVLKAAIRRSCLRQQFTPVFLGTALKNVGVQTMLDGVIDYLPAPPEVTNTAMDKSTLDEQTGIMQTVTLDPNDPLKPLVGLAFKLEESRFGQLTYMRIYQGSLQRGDMIYNANTGKKIKIPRLVRMHSNSMEDIEGKVSGGEIVAMFGVDCSSGDTFTDGKSELTMTQMFVPDPVMSLAIEPTKREAQANFSKALSRFTREDPTFRVSFDQESKQTIISGMGELHLEIYVERMKREYNVECKTGQPQVNYRETVLHKANFDYLHRKQSGGSGQYGRVMGYVEPIPDGERLENGEKKVFEFVNNLVGNNIPPQFVSACEKGFKEATEKGPLLGHRVEGVRVVLTDGAAHSVDSNEMAFKQAARGGFRQALSENSCAAILEPIMSVEVQAPDEFQGNVVAGINKRKGLIQNTETSDGYAVISAEVPLANMFGYSTDLRSSTQGKGEFTMEYKMHAPVLKNVQDELIAEYAKQREQGSK